MALVNVQKLAGAMNVTTRRVAQLVHEGLPREERGKYDLAKCLLWYIRYLQNALEHRGVPTPDGEVSSMKEERLALLRVDRELREIELAEKRGSLVSIADVEKTLSDLVPTTKARIMGIAPRLAAELVGESSRVMIQAKIEREIRTALAHLEKREA
jgi:phage terminase Nu1 subunit (DNA packaging protein)